MVKVSPEMESLRKNSSKTVLFTILVSLMMIVKTADFTNKRRINITRMTDM